MKIVNPTDWIGFTKDYKRDNSTGNDHLHFEIYQDNNPTAYPQHDRYDPLWYLCYDINPQDTTAPEFYTGSQVILSADPGNGKINYTNHRAVCQARVNNNWDWTVDAVVEGDIKMLLHVFDKANRTYGHCGVFFISRRIENELGWYYDNKYEINFTQLLSSDRSSEEYVYYLTSNTSDPDRTTSGDYYYKLYYTGDDANKPSCISNIDDLDIFNKGVWKTTASDYWNAPLVPDGKYRIHFVILDVAFNMLDAWINVLVDNEKPIIIHSNYTSVPAKGNLKIEARIDKFDCNNCTFDDYVKVIYKKHNESWAHATPVFLQEDFSDPSKTNIWHTFPDIDMTFLNADNGGFDYYIEVKDDGMIYTYPPQGTNAPISPVVVANITNNYEKNDVDSATIYNPDIPGLYFRVYPASSGWSVSPAPVFEEYLSTINWNPNIFFGIGLNAQNYVYRIETSSKIYREERFTIIEPTFNVASVNNDSVNDIASVDNVPANIDNVVFYLNNNLNNNYMGTPSGNTYYSSIPGLNAGDDIIAGYYVGDSLVGFSGYAGINTNLAPIIEASSCLSPLTHNHPYYITSKVWDINNSISNVHIIYSLDNKSTWGTNIMYDDGGTAPASVDQTPNNDIYTGEIPALPSAGTIYYYIIAQDNDTNAPNGGYIPSS